MRFPKLLVIAVIALGCTTAAVEADSMFKLDLSTHSSDATPISQLNASFLYEVTGNSLTITVENTGTDFNINAMYFNAPDSVTGLSYDGTEPTGWSFETPGAGNPTRADGFGDFDFAMIDGVGGGNPNVINAGETLVFSFTFTGTATAAAFALSGSTEGYFAAAKFVNGPDDPEDEGNEDSAFGAIIPVPPALPMGIAGLFGVVILRRRVRSLQPRRAA